MLFDEIGFEATKDIKRIIQVYIILMEDILEIEADVERLKNFNDIEEELVKYNKIVSNDNYEYLSSVLLNKDNTIRELTLKYIEVIEEFVKYMKALKIDIITR